MIESSCCIFHLLHKKSEKRHTSDFPPYLPCQASSCVLITSVLSLQNVSPADSVHAAVSHEQPVSAYNNGHHVSNMTKVFFASNLNRGVDRLENT